MRAHTTTPAFTGNTAAAPLHGVLFLALLATLACGTRTGGAAMLGNAAAAQRLTGTWDVTMQLDPRTTVRVPAAAAVSGTIALIVDHRGLPDTDALQGVTHVGVYDLDFAAFGWGTDDPANPASAIARVTPLAGDGTEPDSVTAVLSPGSSALMIRMAGTLSGDSVRGRWSADTYRAGGGSGQFVMHRRDRGR